jgi:hypothetical protein
MLLEKFSNSASVVQKRLIGEITKKSTVEAQLKARDRFKAVRFCILP